MKVLVVDDNQYMRTAIRSSIEVHMDWIVCGKAHNGRVAIAMAKTLKPHLVILDLSMPERTGWMRQRDFGDFPRYADGHAYHARVQLAAGESSVGGHYTRLLKTGWAG